LRTYLFVPPEEKAEVQTLGGRWDDETKRWYIDLDQPAATFAKWLAGAGGIDSEDDAAFTIVSDKAFVAATDVPCQHCASNIEVICIHCESGTASGEPLTEFTVSYIWAMGDELKEQLRPWPHFRKADGPDTELVVNHCPHCAAPQDDLYLHAEPGDPFFDISSAPPGSIEMTPLFGAIRLSGDEHFQVT
jgi:hypothetical protein